MTSKRILILALSLFAICVAEPECSPDNQCRDLWAAKKCNVVKYCIAEDWSRLKPTGNRDDVCSICLEMVKEARDQLQSNETRLLLKEVFEGSCRLLVLKPAVELCDRLVDQFAEELVDILSSQMDPEAVCSVAKLCNNEAFRIAQKNSKDCIHCDAFAQASDQMMQSVTLSQFKNGILDVCQSAGTFSDACLHLGLMNADSLYDIAKSVVKRKPCEATLLCPSTPNGVPKPLNPESMSTTKKTICPLCKTVMRSVRKQLLKAKTPERFAERVFRLCDELDISNSTCSQLAGPEFYEKLKSSEALPDFFCHVAYCREAPKKEAVFWPLVPVSERLHKDVLEFLSILDFLLPQKEEETPATVKPRPTIAYGDPIEKPVFLGPVLSSKFYSGDQEECETCMEVLGILEEPVRNDDDYLNKMFDIVCIGVKNSEKCKRFIDKYSPVLTRAFAEGGVSKEMCADLVPYCQIKRRETTQPESCKLCLNAMNVVKHGDSELWGSSLEQKCRQLPKGLPYICKDLSLTFGTLFSLLQTSTENEMCSSAKLCEPSPIKTQAPSKPTCQSCVLTVQSITDVLKSNSSDVVIQSVLDSLCDLLPHVEKHLCRNLVKNIGVEGFRELIDKINPTEICRELHICKRQEEKNTTESTTPVAVAPSAAPVKDKVPCKFCLMAVTMLLDELQDNKTEESIRKALDGLCGYFPEETRQTCRNLVDSYTDYLIDMILADFNASEICTFLKLCPLKQLIGVDDGHDRNFATFNIDTNEVRDWEDLMENDSKMSSEQALSEFHKVVQECALCEALVGVIITHKKMMRKGYDFQSNAHKICSIVPDDKVEMCESMITSYGPSIVNLLVDHKVDPNEVCVYLALCDEKMQAKVNLPVSVPEPKEVPEDKKDCMLGPVFWCANAENAEKCGTFLHCQETVWKSWKSPPTRRSDNL